MNTQKRLITPKNAVPRPTKDNSNNTDKNVFTSSVREAFKLMSTLIYPGIPVVYLDLCAKVLQKKHLETVFEERSTQKLCAFPPCIEKLEVKKGKFRISLARKEIYDAETENKFCSQHCLKKARVFLARLNVKPPQLVPSLMEVFGIDEPNPFTFDENQMRNSNIMADSVPQAKTVWAKTQDLGIIERKKDRISQLEVPSNLASSTPIVKENQYPGAPTRQFPDQTQAVLIEGYVFPAHKEKLAKKVEHAVQHNMDYEANDIILSDSDESSDVASSCSSWDISDDEVDATFSALELPLFANLWRLFSAWITHETNLLVAGFPIPLKKQTDDITEKEKNPEELAARRVLAERLDAFSLMLNRIMPDVISSLKLPCDRFLSRRIFEVIKSFDMRNAIDGRNSHEWTCIATILLLIAHQKTPEQILNQQIDGIEALTRLDANELQQLLSLFYNLRNDKDIAVDAVMDDTSQDMDMELPVKKDNQKRSVMCRKCRRASEKCVCESRQAEFNTKIGFSSDELSSMMREAMTLREEHQDFLDALD